jgi:hypothetical protein
MPRFKGGRARYGTGLEPQLERWLAKEAARDGVTSSWVLNNLVSFVSGIPAFSLYKTRTSKWDESEGKVIRMPRRKAG